MEQILIIWERFQYDPDPSVWFVPQNWMHKVLWSLFYERDLEIFLEHPGSNIDSDAGLNTFRVQNQISFFKYNDSHQLHQKPKLANRQVIIDVYRPISGVCQGYALDIMRDLILEEFFYMLKKLQIIYYPVYLNHFQCLSHSIDYSVEVIAKTEI